MCHGVYAKQIVTNVPVNLGKLFSLAGIQCYWKTGRLIDQWMLQVCYYLVAEPTLLN